MNRGDMFEKPHVDGAALLAQRGHRALQIDGVPQDDGRDHQVQATGAMPLLVVGDASGFSTRGTESASAVVSYS